MLVLSFFGDPIDYTKGFTHKANTLILSYIPNTLFKILELKMLCNSLTKSSLDG